MLRRGTKKNCVNVQNRQNAKCIIVENGKSEKTENLFAFNVDIFKIKKYRELEL